MRREHLAQSPPFRQRTGAPAKRARSPALLYGNGTSAATAATAAQIVAVISTTPVANATAATALAAGAAGEIPYQTGVGSTGFSAAGTTGQALVSGGTGAPTWNDLWLPEKIVAANCNNATAGNGMSLPTSSAPTAFCRTGSNVQAGALRFTATAQSAQFQTEVPGDIDTASLPYVRLNYTQGTDTTNTHVIAFSVQAICAATDDTAFPTAIAFPTTTIGTTANTQYTVTTQLNAANFPAACSAGAMINFKIASTASLTDVVTNLQMVTVTWPHKTPAVSEAN